MTSPNYESTDPSYSKLIKRALRHIGRDASREQALAAAIASAEALRDEALLDAGFPDNAADTVPSEIIETLRAAPGQDRLIVVHHDGMRITAILHPIGRPHPEREAAVWRCLRDTAISVRKERRRQ